MLNTLLSYLIWFISLTEVWVTSVAIFLWYLSTLLDRLRNSKCQTGGQSQSQSQSQSGGSGVKPNRNMNIKRVRFNV